MPVVTAEDHILGNPDAPIVIIEYTDLECPYCKQFHATMQTLMNEYGPFGKVAWVMRNFPIVQLHPNATTMAEAAECIAHELGNTAYWRFLSEIFTIAPAGSFFPLDRLEEVAVKVGANPDRFNQCVAQNAYKELIAKQFDDAVKSGGQGTPHSIIMTKDGKISQAIEGSQPYATMKQIIEAILADSSNQSTTPKP